MAWEIYERKPTRTLWRGTDEGHTVYQVTRNREGMACEPSGGGHRAKKYAWEEAKGESGRPRTPGGTGDGQPKVEARVPAEVAAWVKAQPGGLKALVMAEYERRAKC